VRGQSGEKRCLKFYAGEKDPSDPAAFTLQYELKNMKGTLRFKLSKDCKSLLAEEITPILRGTL